MVDNRKRRRGMGLISLPNPSDWPRIYRDIRNWLKYWRFPSIVYYIPPTRAHSDYYARLQIALETEIDGLPEDVWWRYCPPPENRATDIYVRFEQVLKVVRPSDIIVIVPKGLHDSNTADRFHDQVNEHPSARIVFLDQAPPPRFLDDKRFSFVVIDNRKVGILAAFALHKEFANVAEYKYCVVSGPGGDARLNGFVEGVSIFDSNNTIVHRFDIGDKDRLHSLSDIGDYIEGLPPATSIGIFAGNDETATAVLWALRTRNAGNAFVVGCDSTPEMRLLVDDKRTPAIATIDTNIRNQAEKAVGALRIRVCVFQEPKLYPKPLDITFKELLELNPKFANLWKNAR